jgi:4-hydroxy-tetrahydrodipicolinate synthase
MKDITECHARLRGLFNITVTPFKADGAFDHAGLARNIERVIGLGFDGILIGGTYGEFPAMSAEERADLFRRVMDIVGDRVPVMLCSAGSDVRVVRELTTLAGELGGLPMVTPPFVSEITDAQIVAFFRDMVPLSRTGVLVYNAPGIGVTLSPSTLEQLAEIPGVVGVKQGDLSPTAIDRIANRIGGRIRLFCASDLAFLGPMMCGFDGISSTNSCALPELILAVYRALEAGDAATAREPAPALVSVPGARTRVRPATDDKGRREPARLRRRFGPPAAAGSQGRQYQGRRQGAASVGGRSAIQRCSRRLTTEPETPEHENDGPKFTEEQSNESQTVAYERRVPPVPCGRAGPGWTRHCPSESRCCHRSVVPDVRRQCADRCRRAPRDGNGGRYHQQFPRSRFADGEECRSRRARQCQDQAGLCRPSVRSSEGAGGGRAPDHPG